MDVAARFRRMCLRDPIYQALCRDEMSWADIIDDQDYTRIHKIHNAWADLDSQDDLDSQYDSDEPVVAFYDQPRRTCRTPPPQVEPVVAVYKPTTLPPIPTGIKTIITRNLPRDITVEQLRTVFEKYGPIRDIYIPKNMDKSSPYFGTVKGFALIKFLKPDDSASAFKSEYSRLTIAKNNITVEFAKEDR
jgi:hypothetical protein